MPENDPTPIGPDLNEILVRVLDDPKLRTAYEAEKDRHHQLLKKIQETYRKIRWNLRRWNQDTESMGRLNLEGEKKERVRSEEERFAEAIRKLLDPSRRAN